MNQKIYIVIAVGAIAITALGYNTNHLNVTMAGRGSPISHVVLSGGGRRDSTDCNKNSISEKELDHGDVLFELSMFQHVDSSTIPLWMRVCVHGLHGREHSRSGDGVRRSGARG